jgi:hypothetical protein
VTLDITNLGFTVVSLPNPTGVGMQRVARFQCTGCDGHLDVPVKGTIGPDFLTSRAQKKGWLADADKKAAAKCPRCRNSRLKEPKMSSVTPIKPLAVQQIKPPAAPLTPDQRARIRNYLDKHFDDSTGTYLDDMSDQKIADAVNAPRGLVERIRESAYGPIRNDAETNAIREAIVALRGEYNAWGQSLKDQRTFLDQVGARLTALEDRLGKLVESRAA